VFFGELGNVNKFDISLKFWLSSSFCSGML
jgi:hypothetical protein